MKASNVKEICGDCFLRKPSVGVDAKVAVTLFRDSEVSANEVSSVCSAGLSAPEILGYFQKRSCPRKVHCSKTF